MSETVPTNRQFKATRALQAVAALAVIFAAVRLIGMAGNCVSGRCRTAPDVFDSTMEAVQKTDPRLVWYHELSRIPTGLKEPCGIALDRDGRIYVAGDFAVRVFDASGTHRLDIRTAARPYALSVSDDGMVYAAMRDHVEVFDQSGRRASSWASPGKRVCLTSIAVTPDDVWVADAGNRVVLRYNQAGQPSGVFAAKDASKNAPGLVVPSPYVDLTPAVNGGVWVSDPGRHQLELYASDGRLRRMWGRASFGVDGFSGCCNPTNFALLPDGRFVTSEKGIPRVKVYTPDGKLQCIVAGRETFDPGTAGLDIAVDKSGRILILDPAARVVRVFVRKHVGA